MAAMSNIANLFLCTLLKGKAKEYFEVLNFLSELVSENLKYREYWYSWLENWTIIIIYDIIWYLIV